MLFLSLACYFISKLLQKTPDSANKRKIGTVPKVATIISEIISVVSLVIYPITNPEALFTFWWAIGFAILIAIIAVLHICLIVFISRSDIVLQLLIIAIIIFWSCSMLVSSVDESYARCNADASNPIYSEYIQQVEHESAQSGVFSFLRVVLIKYQIALLTEVAFIISTTVYSVSGFFAAVFVFIGSRKR